MHILIGDVIVYVCSCVRLSALCQPRRRQGTRSSHSQAGLLSLSSQALVTALSWVGTYSWGRSDCRTLPENNFRAIKNKSEKKGEMKFLDSHQRLGPGPIDGLKVP